MVRFNFRCMHDFKHLTSAYTPSAYRYSILACFQCDSGSCAPLVLFCPLLEGRKVATTSRPATLDAFSVTVFLVLNIFFYNEFCVTDLTFSKIGFCMDLVYFFMMVSFFFSFFLTYSGIMRGFLGRFCPSCRYTKYA